MEEKEFGERDPKFEAIADYLSPHMLLTGHVLNLVLQRRLSDADDLTCENVAGRGIAIAALQGLTCDFSARPAHVPLQY
jgi:hypothetical protein